MNWLSPLVELLRYLWFLRAVEQWQRGCYYVLGRYWRTVGPGRWPVIPFFMDVKTVDVKRDPKSTPLLTITRRDGSLLSFSATAIVEVVDPALALNEVQDYESNTMEFVGSLLAERLADEMTERTDPAYRERFQRTVGRLLQEINSETQSFGVAVRALRFPNYILGVRTYRILSERATVLAPSAPNAE